MSGTGQSREPVAIMPIEFWTEYSGEGADMKAADWVRWVKKGDSMRSTVAEKVSRLKKGMVGEEIWAVIKPYYERWKEGQDAPVIGMPLDAAPFATKEMVRVLAQVEIRSVEDLANAEEAALNKLPIPGIIGMRAKAKALLDTRANLAPVSVNNFLDYVNAGFYRLTIFHRVVKDFVVQAGGYTAGPVTPVVKAPTSPAIVLESKNGLKNVKGSIAMARTSAPDSATSQFYINTVDNPSLDFKSDSEPGYAVFGSVITGMDVIDKLNAVPVRVDLLSGLTHLPVTNVVILSALQTK